MAPLEVRPLLPGTPAFLDLRQAALDPRSELAAGLLAARASIAPKYFYDELGSRLFESICELPEYPLLRTERAIFEAFMPVIAEEVGRGSVFIDLGAGNCEKAESLFPWLAPSQYVAVDIAADFLRERLGRLAERHPQIEVVGIAQDFTAALELPAPVRSGRRLLFYPGSSIGNFAPTAAREFLERTRMACGADGRLLIGVDLVKDKRLLDLAYDDPLGVTAAFNLNVLRNVNALLESNFDVADWRHVAFFDPQASRIEMHVEARCDVTVSWPGAERRFAAGDRIHTENSYKYTTQQMHGLLQSAGYGEVRLFVDDERSFAVALASA
jgi:dimethylhistidine N-methyltransferase